MNAQALYPMNEHDACGVGLVANINNVASHQIVLQGITVLKRLMHRGAAGGDPETGDGAGLLLSMPHKFFRKVNPGLPARYGVAMLFVENTLDAGAFDEKIKEIAAAEGMPVLNFREGFRFRIRQRVRHQALCGPPPDGKGLQGPLYLQLQPP